MAAMLGVLVLRHAARACSSGSRVSLLLLLYRASRPERRRARPRARRRRPVGRRRRATRRTPAPDGVVVLRVEGGLFFANADTSAAHRPTRARRDGVHAVVLDAETIPFIDVTAAQMLDGSCADDLRAARRPAADRARRRPGPRRAAPHRRRPERHPCPPHRRGGGSGGRRRRRRVNRRRITRFGRRVHHPGSAELARGWARRSARSCRWASASPSSGARRAVHVLDDLNTWMERHRDPWPCSPAHRGEADRRRDLRAVTGAAAPITPPG